MKHTQKNMYGQKNDHKCATDSLYLHMLQINRIYQGKPTGQTKTEAHDRSNRSNHSNFCLKKNWTNQNAVPRGMYRYALNLTVAHHFFYNHRMGVDSEN